MAGTTPNFNLTKLNANEDFSGDGYKYTDADRVLIDRLLNAALNHDHSGAPPGVSGETVSTAPILTLDPNAGSLPAGVRMYYKIALIGPDGLPTMASPETIIDAPNPVFTPDAPIATRSATGGTLHPGTYYYRLSAWRAASTLETAAGNSVSVPLPVVDGTTQRVILDLPSMPAGAGGYNIYRRIPGGAAFVHIATIDAVDVGTPWIDDGAHVVNCERFSPTSNTTSSSNSVEIDYPGGVVPVGYTWRIYRTVVSGDWAHSQLADVVEETSEGSGIVTPSFLDLGLGTTAGSPPVTNPPTIPTPAQITYADILLAPDPGIGSSTGIEYLERVTQAEYDALAPPDPATVYLIVA